MQVKSLNLEEILKRLLARLPDLYYKETDSNIRKLFTIFAKQGADLHDVFSDTRKAHWVDYATGQSLDNIGALLKTPRRLYETDDDYRKRLKTIIPTFEGGGTIDQLKIVIAPAAGCTVDDITIEDGYTHNAAYGHFRVLIDAAQISQMSPQDVKDAIDANRGAGIKCDWFGPATSEEQASADEWTTSVSDFYFLESQPQVDDGNYYHHTNITYSDSLNITYPG